MTLQLYGHVLGRLKNSGDSSYEYKNKNYQINANINEPLFKIN